MNLQQIYARDIERHINAAVVVGDREQDVIDAEIREYVFTDELIEHFFKLLNTVLNKEEGKTGIWVNGYYGSGKSHFIKYFHYLLDAPTTDLAFEMLEKALDSYDDARGLGSGVSLSNLRQLRNKVRQTASEDIMFNLERETDDHAGERVTRIMLNMLNQHRGFNKTDIPLALLLEKSLDSAGKLEEFKSTIQSRFQVNWDEGAYLFAKTQLNKVLEVGKELLPDLDTESIRASILNKGAFHVGVDTLIKELNEYAATKGENFKLLFLIDEVSQYVGTNKDILLNFQTIIEDISARCDNRVWVLCTAQQQLDEVSQGVNGVDDVEGEFGKILGRFDTRISLASTDAAEITQRRVLDKNSAGLQEIGGVFDGQKDYIENQFNMQHDLYKGFEDKEAFLMSYPFVPYQFRLISHVFQAFQALKFVQTEVRDSERSILGITHFTAKLVKDKEVGYFVPFDAFFNGQLQQNLTHAGTAALGPAFSLTYVQGSEMAQRVVQSLFMVSNLLEQHRQTFPPTVENIAILLMDGVDINKMALQREVREVLERLKQSSVVREENGSFFFFNEDEMQVQTLIEGMNPTLDEQFNTFHQDFLAPMTQLRQKHDLGSNQVNIGLKVEEKVIFQSGKFDVIVTLNEDKTLDQMALQLASNTLVIGVHEWFKADLDLQRDFKLFCKTNKYLVVHGAGGQTGGRAQTNQSFKLRNEDLKASILQSLKSKFSETRFVSQQRVMESNEVAGASAKDRWKAMLDKHVQGVFQHHSEASDYAQNKTALLTSAGQNAQVTMNMGLTPAEEKVNNFIDRNGGEITVTDLFSEFSKEPFGWTQYAILDVAVHLHRKKKREFKYSNEPRYSPVNFVTKALTSAEQSSCVVTTGEAIPMTLLADMRSAYADIFNGTRVGESTDGTEQFDLLKEALDRNVSELTALESDHSAYPWASVFRTAKDMLDGWARIRDPKSMFDAVIAGQGEGKQAMDAVEAIKGFGHLPKYREIQDFIRSRAGDLQTLDADAQAKVAEVNTFLVSTNPAEGMRLAARQYDELKSALTDKLEVLKAEVQTEYESLFAELTHELDQRGVQVTLTDPNSKLQEIASATSIGQLQQLKFALSGFREAELKKILGAANAASGSATAPANATFTMRTHASSISNEAELDEYLAKTRSDLKQLLDEGKTIILR